jgi:hypothetical protein
MGNSTLPRASISGVKFEINERGNRVHSSRLSMNNLEDKMQDKLHDLLEDDSNVKSIFSSGSDFDSPNNRRMSAPEREDPKKKCSVM